MPVSVICMAAPMRLAARGGKAVDAEDGLRPHLGGERFDHLHRLHAGDAEHARGDGADAAHALVGKARQLLEHVARDQRAVHSLRAEGVRCDAAIAKAHDQHRRVAFAGEHAGDLLAKQVRHRQAGVQVSVAHGRAFQRHVGAHRLAQGARGRLRFHDHFREGHAHRLPLADVHAGKAALRALKGSIARSVRICRIESTSFSRGSGISLPKFFIKMYESPCIFALCVLK